MDAPSISHKQSPRSENLGVAGRQGERVLSLLDLAGCPGFEDFHLKGPESGLDCLTYAFTALYMPASSLDWLVCVRSNLGLAGREGEGVLGLLDLARHVVQL